MGVANASYTITLDVAPTPGPAGPAGLDINQPLIQNTALAIANGRKGTNFTLANIGNSQVIAFEGIASGQVICINGNGNPVDVALTQNGVVQHVYGAVLFLAQPDSGHILTACTITALVAATTVDVTIAG